MKVIAGVFLTVVLVLNQGCGAEKRMPTGQGGTVPDAPASSSGLSGSSSTPFNPAVGDEQIKSSEVAYNMSNEYAQQGAWEAADHYIDLAIRMTPDAKYSYAKGLIALAQGKHALAKQWLERSLAQGPGTAENKLDVRNALGAACMQLGEDENALEQFRQVVNSPGMVSRYKSYYNMGVIYVRQEKWLDADAVLQKVVDENPGYYRAWNKLSLVEAQRGNWSRSAECAKQAVDIVSKNYAALQSDGSEIYYNLGEALFQLKRYEESREALMSALKIAPETDAGRKAKERLAVFGTP